MKNLNKMWIVAVLLMSASDLARGQDFNAMNAAWNAQSNAQMNSMTNQMVQTNMNNPYIWQQYQVYQSQGGQLTFPAYCFRYSETGGFTPEGTKRAVNASNAVHQQDMANYGRYVDESRRVKQETYDYRNAKQDEWAHQRGDVLIDRGTFVNPVDGSSWRLPANIWPGQTYYDAPSGNTFYRASNNQFMVFDGTNWRPIYYRP